MLKPQMLNSNIDSSKIIDEYYNPKNLNEKAHLEDLVENLDPLNKDDVQKYWASRGIHING